jgi:hypothetical protein
MPDRQTAPLADTPQASNPDFGIVVEEPAFYPWPQNLDSTKFGRPIKRIRYYFDPFINAIRSIRKDYAWHTFYQNSESRSSYIEGYPEILAQLERLFEDELGTKYTEAQYQLLIRSQIIVVAVSNKNGSIAGYFSSSYADSNTINGIDIPITFGNHGVISREHQQYKIGVTMGAITTLHGQKLSDLFSQIACVLRTNNRNILNPLKQAGTVYRSDELSGDALDNIETTAKAAISYMHNKVFQLSDVHLPFDRPLNIEHRFDPAFTIERVSPDQIIYICCVTSLSKCIYKLFARRPRRKKKT